MTCLAVIPRLDIWAMMSVTYPEYTKCDSNTSIKGVILSVYQSSWLPL